MMVYNVTIKVEHSIHSAWLKWLKEEHIPEMIATGCFTHAVTLHLFESDDEEGITYAVQYFAPDKETYERYLSNHADEMRGRGKKKWGDSFIAFRTVMKVVQ